MILFAPWDVGPTEGGQLRTAFWLAVAHLSRAERPNALNAERTRPTGYRGPLTDGRR
jgi:hypothetical protein